MRCARDFDAALAINKMGNGHHKKMRSAVDMTPKCTNCGRFHSIATGCDNPVHPRVNPPARSLGVYVKRPVNQVKPLMGFGRKRS
jgi:hypothetical protein